MKHVFASLTVGFCLVLSPTGSVFATGQPGASDGVACTVSSNAIDTPGHAASAGNPAGTNGSPFNQSVAKEYAGNTGNPTTSNGSASSNAVSQYDVACRNATTREMKQIP
jgi:hypothetical protein